MSGETIARAHGRWREILPRLGVDPKFLTNRHGPCPLCGGKDRFRFDDKHGDGTYYCGQCRPGSGLILLQKLHGWSWKEAADEVDKIIGTDTPINVAALPDPTDDQERRRQRLQHVIDDATDLTIVGEYLNGRGLTVIPTILFGHRALAYYSEDRKFVGRYPAMIAPVIGPDGALQSVHRTYIADVPSRKKLTAKVDAINGAAVRLFEPTDVLAVAEGIETAIAAYELFNVPVWAVLNSGNMEKWRPPESVRALHIFGDNDSHKEFAGQSAAFNLARAVRRETERTVDVEVHIPPTQGTDWLDVLNSRKAA